MINQPHQNCEFGCQPNSCKHNRNAQIIDGSTLHERFDLDWDSESFLNFSEWMSEDLERLEKRFESFTTFASRRKFMQR